VIANDVSNDFRILFCCMEVFCVCVFLLSVFVHHLLVFGRFVAARGSLHKLLRIGGASYTYPY